MCLMQTDLTRSFRNCATDAFVHLLYICTNVYESDKYRRVQLITAVNGGGIVKNSLNEFNPGEAQ